MRSDLDGKNMITIVPPGSTFTPKQLQSGEEERQALHVGPGRHAGDAGKPGRVGNRNSRGYEPGPFLCSSRGAKADLARTGDETSR